QAFSTHCTHAEDVHAEDVHAEDVHAPPAPAHTATAQGLLTVWPAATLSRADRTSSCPCCDRILDRDDNASRISLRPEQASMAAASPSQEAPGRGRGGCHRRPMGTAQHCCLGAIHG